MPSCILDHLNGFSLMLVQISSAVSGFQLNQFSTGLLRQKISTVGEVFGWFMAAIYMGGRLPQIWLNVNSYSKSLNDHVSILHTSILDLVCLPFVLFLCRFSFFVSSFPLGFELFSLVFLSLFLPCMETPLISYTTSFSLYSTRLPSFVNCKNRESSLCV